MLNHPLRSFSFSTSYFNIFLDSTSSSSKASNNYVPSDLTLTSSNETETHSTSSNAVISIDDGENELLELKSPAPLIYKIPEQDEISKQINFENGILVVLYKKKELNQLTENDLKEIKTG